MEEETPNVTQPESEIHCWEIDLDPLMSYEEQCQEQLEDEAERCERHEHLVRRRLERLELQRLRVSVQET